jgi:ABC-2 type transport system permease protein
MAAETQQALALSVHGWLTPLLAVADASRAVSGTDLAHYHRFLREAEDLRYAFVQRLNQIHAEKLTYADDIRRSSDTEAERRTRVDAANWQLLERFRFQPDAAGIRIQQARTQWLMLGLWCALLMMATFWLGGRLKP